MAENKKTELAAEAAATPPVAQAPTSRFKLVGLRNQKEFFVPVTGRTYKLDEITEDQLEQLHVLKWPHVQLVQAE
ncbi:hypothetical protein [Fibrivirga algicola]|uniref:Mu-like prophage FluMu N-terminal domain-containing protein n=1 Tax=Fibrivirga algicola TaxID=2950420 RepID=A0ABX0QNN8_9BACT|nr:hypothetical protein [Fibrivirga algicola]NID13767.1 hypothetical protein [Fibrivirga algicola]